MAVVTPYTDAILDLPALQAFWPLSDSPDSGVALDVSPHARSGAYAGSPPPLRGQSPVVHSEQGSPSLQCNPPSAVNQWSSMRVPDFPQLELGGSYTIGLSITIPSGLPDTDDTVSPSNRGRHLIYRSLGGYALHYEIEAGVITLHWRTYTRDPLVQTAGLTAVLAADVEQHIYLTYDGSETRLYVNGVEADSVGAGGCEDASAFDNQIYLSGIPGVGFSSAAEYRLREHAGRLSHVFMATASIDDAAALALYQLTLLDPYQNQLAALSVVSHWKLDEPSAGTTVAVDSVGANDGTYLNSAGNPVPFVGMASPSLVPTEPGSGSASAHASLTVEDGEHVLVGDDVSLQIADQVTIGLIARPDDTGPFGLLADQTLLQKGAFSSYALRITADGRVECSVNLVAGGVLTIATAPGMVVMDGATYDIVGAFDGANGSGVYLFVNGGLVAQEEASGSISYDNSTHTGDLFIGAGFLAPSSLDDPAFAGLDEVFLSSAAISPAEARALHAASDSFALPDVVTGSASDITGTGATLHGTVDPNSWPTSYWFEYGTTTAYGASSPVGEDGNAGLGGSVVAVEAPLVGLHPGVTRHYRLVAEGPYGIVFGEDEEFTTPPVNPGTIPSRVGGL